MCTDLFIFGIKEGFIFAFDRSTLDVDWWEEGGCLPAQSECLLLPLQMVQRGCSGSQWHPNRKSTWGCSGATQATHAAWVAILPCRRLQALAAGLWNLQLLNTLSLHQASCE